MSEPAGASDVAVARQSEVDTTRLSADAVPLVVRSWGLTDRGKVRPRNEDHFLVARLVKALQVQQTSLPRPGPQHSSDHCHLFVVADGMGGHAGGEQASTLAIDAVRAFVLESLQWFAQCKGREQDEVLADFQKNLAQANAYVLAEAAEHAEWHGMGTTVTLAYSLNDVLFVAHVGDSRCYLFRAEVLHRLTSDHTVAEELVRRGLLSAEEAVKHRWRHMVTNCVGGTSADVQVEVHKVRLQADDVVLLCSDGLTEMVADEAIAHTLQEQADPEQICKRLVAEANEQGGRDNVTVIAAHFEPAA